MDGRISVSFTSNVQVINATISLLVEKRGAVSCAKVSRVDGRCFIFVSLRQVGGGREGFRYLSLRISTLLLLRSAET